MASGDSAIGQATKESSVDVVNAFEHDKLFFPLRKSILFIKLLLFFVKLLNYNYNIVQLFYVINTYDIFHAGPVI